MHRATEDMKQELESSKGFSRQAAFEAIDDCIMGYIYPKNLERFFNAQRKKTTEADHFALIRRIDLDADQKINKEEFWEAIQPQEPYSKMLVRARCAKRGPRQPCLPDAGKKPKKV